MVEQLYYQNVPYVAIKNRNLLRKKEAKGLLSSLGIRTPLNKIPYYVMFCFHYNSIKLMI